MAASTIWAVASASSFAADNRRFCSSWPVVVRVQQKIQERRDREYKKKGKGKEVWLDGLLLNWLERTRFLSGIE